MFRFDGCPLLNPKSPTLTVPDLSIKQLSGFVSVNQNLREHAGLFAQSVNKERAAGMSTLDSAAPFWHRD
jgi:hypothetical protein